MNFFDIVGVAEMHQLVDGGRMSSNRKFATNCKYNRHKAKRFGYVQFSYSMEFERHSSQKQSRVCNCTVIVATKPHFPIHLASENLARTRNGSIDGAYLAFGIGDDEPCHLCMRSYCTHLKFGRPALQLMMAARWPSRRIMPRSTLLDGTDDGCCCR